MSLYDKGRIGLGMVFVRKRRGSVWHCRSTALVAICGQPVGGDGDTAKLGPFARHEVCPRCVEDGGL